MVRWRERADEKEETEESRVLEGCRQGVVVVVIVAVVVVALERRGTREICPRKIATTDVDIAASISGALHGADHRDVRFRDQAMTSVASVVGRSSTV